MTGVLLEGQIDCTVDHNDIVPLLLGLSKILDEVSERVGAGADRRRGGRGTVEPVDEDLVLAVLGLLSVRQTLRRWLRQCPSAPLPPKVGHSDTRTMEADLLR